MLFETPLLTVEQRKRLITRDKKKETELDAYKKRRNDQIVLKKFVDYFESIPDVLLILNTMPRGKITTKLERDPIPLVLDLLEALLVWRDPWPIGEHEEEGMVAFRVFGNAIPLADHGKCTIDSISRTASEEEIALNRRLKEHFEKIRYFIDPCIPDPVCRDPGYIGMEREKAMDIVKRITRKSDETFHVNCSAYLDSWVGKDNWVERKPTLVDIETLKFMRWKPRGLKDCMEQPPLLAPKEVSFGPEIQRLTAQWDAKGARYMLSERGGEEHPITEKEFIEKMKSLTEEYRKEDLK
jgi:hypothetical protein